LLLMVNAHDLDTQFKLPPGEWQVLLDSAEPDGVNPWQRNGASHFPLRARSLVLLTDTVLP
jgi:pullulanase/glycogen debranching enzyme